MSNFKRTNSSDEPHMTAQSIKRTSKPKVRLTREVKIRRAYQRNYYKKYYQLHKANYLKAVQKYRSTPKGLKNQIECYKRFEKKNPNYHKDYLRKWKIRMKAEEKCLWGCGRTAKLGFFHCEPCLVRIRQNSRKMRRLKMQRIKNKKSRIARNGSGSVFRRRMR